jgi:hypothetical protein
MTQRTPLSMQDELWPFRAQCTVQQCNALANNQSVLAMTAMLVRRRGKTARFGRNEVVQREGGAPLDVETASISHFRNHDPVCRVWALAGYQ